jgi:hypothetical protein
MYNRLLAYVKTSATENTETFEKKPLKLIFSAVSHRRARGTNGVISVAKIILQEV